MSKILSAVQNENSYVYEELLSHIIRTISQIIGRIEKILVMLYQGRYLTIKGYDSTRGKHVLDFPNDEASRLSVALLMQSSYYLHIVLLT